MARLNTIRNDVMSMQLLCASTYCNESVQDIILERLDDISSSVDVSTHTIEDLCGKSIAIWSHSTLQLYNESGVIELVVDSQKLSHFAYNDTPSKCHMCWTCTHLYLPGQHFSVILFY